MNEKDAQRVKWGQMPFKEMLEELMVRTGGRVIRADDDWVAGAVIPKEFASRAGSIQAIQHRPGLWVEVTVG